MDKEERRGRYSKRVKSRHHKRGKRGCSPWYHLIGRLERRTLAKNPAKDYNNYHVLDFSPIHPPKCKTTIKW